MSVYYNIIVYLCTVKEIHFIWGFLPRKTTVLLLNMKPPDFFTDFQNKRATIPTHPSLSSMDEAQELRELAERMGQLRVQDANEDVKSKEENKREEATTNQGRSQTEGPAEEENLGEPALSHAAGRGSRSSQSDPAVTEEQRRQARRHHSTPAGFLSCKGGDGTEPLGVEGPVRAEPGRDEEQLTKSFVMVERHDK